MDKGSREGERRGRALDERGQRDSGQWDNGRGRGTGGVPKDEEEKGGM